MDESPFFGNQDSMFMTMRMILKETSQNSRRWSEFQNFIIPERLRGAGKMASAWEVWKAKQKEG